MPHPEMLRCFLTSLLGGGVIGLIIDILANLFVLPLLGAQLKKK